MSGKAASAGSAAGLRQLPAFAGFVWGLAEAVAFFIVPDIILGWACLAGVRPGLRMLGAILAGSVIGGLAMYGFAVLDPVQARNLVAAVPFVRGWMFGTVSEAYREHGAAGMLYGPSSGIPYKIYAVLAPAHFDALTFVSLSIPARLERLALSWAGFALCGIAFRRWLAAHRGITLLLYALLWVAIYAFYWTRP